ncbi:MAG: hypothetical protein KKH01_02630 [Firmicutes bacterium]|nr:hypothetical protein [Bacillota bacterium]
METLMLNIKNDRIYKTKNSKEISECDVYFTNSEFSLHIYTGTKNPNDIRIRYKKTNTQMRTPKHSHWVLDTILKKEQFPDLANKFIHLIEGKYKYVKILPAPDFNAYKSFVIEIYKENLSSYKELSNAGEYPIEFLYLLVMLLIAQEKTNYPTGGLFQDMLTSLKYKKIEVFKLLGSEWWK